VVQENITHQHRFYINNEEVLHKTTGSVSFNGNNQLNSLSVKIYNTDLQNQSLESKKVKLFLHSEDSVPLFSGIIKEVVPSDTIITLKCVDVRSWISGSDGYQVNLTDENNYDGYSISSFLYSIISKNVNEKNTVIGLDKLNDISPPRKESFLSNERGIDSVYGIASKLLKKVIDDDDFMNPLRYFFDVIEEYDSSHIVIKKEKLLTETPSIIYSYGDGLSSIKSKKRTIPNTATYEGGKFTYTSAAKGNIHRLPISTAGEESGKADLRNLGIKQILLENQTKDEITISVTHGHYIGLGTIIRLDVIDESIKGNHRVVGKQINFGDKGMCTLSLGKAAPKLSDYLLKI
jgi:hypothetical protein